MPILIATGSYLFVSGVELSRDEVLSSAAHLSHEQAIPFAETEGLATPRGIDIQQSTDVSSHESKRPEEDSRRHPLPSSPSNHRPASSIGSTTSDPSGSALPGAMVYSFAMEVRDCNDSALDDAEAATDLLRQMARIGELTVLGELKHHFEPQGATAMLLVSESHLTIHTWPELSYAVLDVVSCKELTAGVTQEMREAAGRRLGCREVSGSLTLRGSALPRSGDHEPTSPMPARVTADQLVKGGGAWPDSSDAAEELRGVGGRRQSVAGEEL